MKRILLTLSLVLTLCIAGFCVVNAAAEPSAAGSCADVTVVGHNLVLDGTIGVQFYFSTPEAFFDAEQYPDAHAIIEVNGEKQKIYVHQDISNSRKIAGRTGLSNFSTGFSGNVFIFRGEVAAKEMTETITARFYESDEVGCDVSKEFTYTVKDYASYILRYYTYNKELCDVVKAMLHYGSMSQQYFEHLTEKLADAGVYGTSGIYGPADYYNAGMDYYTTSKRNVVSNQNGVKYLGSNLILESSTSLCLYFTIDQPKLLNQLYVMHDGAFVASEFVPTGATNQYKLIIPNVTSTDLADTYHVMDWDGVTYCSIIPLHYGDSVVRQMSDNQKLVALMDALYSYSAYAYQYFGSEFNESLTITNTTYETYSEISLYDKMVKIGLPADLLVARLGQPTRIDDSIYLGVSRYVYNQNYNDYATIFVKDGKVAGWYTDAASFEFHGLKRNASYDNCKTTFGLTDNTVPELKFLNNNEGLSVYLLNDIHTSTLLGIFVGDFKRTPNNINEETIRAEEMACLEATNSFRAIHGLTPVSWHEVAGKVARAHSVDMATQDYFSHTSLDGRSFSTRLIDGGITRWYSMSENLAAGNILAEFSVNQWINSMMGHRENMLGSFNYLGVGLGYSSASTYGAYWTQNYILAP